MGFKNLDIKIGYKSLKDNIPKDFMIPLLEESKVYKRGTGYFSSSALLELSIGIGGLVKNHGHIYMIVSPELSKEDILAIERGLKNLGKVVEETFIHQLEIPASDYQKERLNLLANLIASGVLEIKIACTKNGKGIFHDKFGIVYDDVQNKVAFHGSMNETESGFRSNFEGIDVYKSWANKEDNERVSNYEETFDQLWDNRDPAMIVSRFPRIEEAIINKYRYDHNMDTTIDIRQYVEKESKREWLLTKPEYIDIREYQESAAEKWRNNACRGIYDMATGTGKTITALYSLEEFEREHGNIGIFVICPYVHLVDQWAEEIEDWGAVPIIAYSDSPDKRWYNTLVKRYKQFRSTGKSFACLMTNGTFVTDKVQELINDIKQEMNIVFVADEAHNVGAEKFSKILPDNINYRLALSATVERYGDKKGTEILYHYFGNKCIEYSLAKAIEEGALTQYEYYPIVVNLNLEELAEYKRLTKEIGKYIVISKNNKRKISDTGQQLLFKRSRLVAGAESKIEAFKEVFTPYRDKKNILVYCGATRGFEDYVGQKERQIDRIDQIIGNEFHASVHQFTSEEDADMRRRLKNAFADGEIQVLTAIKCLDEGMNIPNIHTAFILASSRNPKEFIQRRGRVLRRAKGKNRAVIYDFVTIPKPLYRVTPDDFESDRALIIGEMARIYEFGKYSIKSRKAMEVLEQISDAYGLVLDYEDLAEMMEGEYGGDVTEGC